MPKNVRELFAVGYLLCRAADTIADTPVVTDEKKLAYIKDFPAIVSSPSQNSEKLDLIMRNILPSYQSEYEKNLLLCLKKILQAADKLSPQNKQLVHFVVTQVCRGMETDLSYFVPSKKIKAFETAQQLEHYCRYIGGAPGIFWAKSLIINSNIKKNTQHMPEQGAMIGDALQITNILRDMPADLKNGRCYLPLEDLQTVNLTPEDLLNPKSIKSLKPVINKWILWAMERLKFAEPFFSSIPKTQVRYRAATMWPIYWCMDTLHKIAASDNLLDAESKVKIPKSKIYATILKTPAALISNKFFNQGFRLRRETNLSVIPE